MDPVLGGIGRVVEEAQHLLGVCDGIGEEEDELGVHVLTRLSVKYRGHKEIHRIDLDFHGQGPVVISRERKNRETLMDTSQMEWHGGIQESGIYRFALELTRA